MPADSTLRSELGTVTWKRGLTAQRSTISVPPSSVVNLNRPQHHCSKPHYAALWSRVLVRFVKGERSTVCVGGAPPLMSAVTAHGRPTYDMALLQWHSFSVRPWIGPPCLPFFITETLSMMKSQVLWRTRLLNRVTSTFPTRSSVRPFVTWMVDPKGLGRITSPRRQAMRPSLF